MKYLHFWYLLIPIILFAGCKDKAIPTGEVNAQVIEYKVTYLNEKAGSIPTKMLPRKMIVIFADHYALNRIDGFFGQFSLIYIGNLKNASVITMLKVFDKKYVHYGKKGELPCGFIKPEKLTIEKTGKAGELLGLNTIELLVTSDDYPSFLALCTEEIKVKDPNITTPYGDVDEVMLEFNTRLSLLNMNLSATSVEEKIISWDLFRVPDDYHERSKEFMEKKFEELFK